MKDFKGFTLIELMIAILLIAVLGTSVIILIDPVKQFAKGRDAERKSAISQIQAALELYRADQNTYPTTALPACNQPLQAGQTTYIQKMPCDPKDDGTNPDYTYHYDGSAGTSYILVACLENVNDPKKDSVNDDSKCSGGTTNRSYTVTNP